MFEKTVIHFKRDVYAAVAVVNAKTPCKKTLTIISEIQLMRRQVLAS